MNIIKNIINAITGYSNSSENPTQTSARFSGIIITVLSTALTYASLIHVTLPYVPEQLQALGGLLGVLAGFLYWSFGLVRAIKVAVQTKNLGALYGK